MSVLTLEPYPATSIEQQVVIAMRLVDSATRLHAWSIPLPRCVHGIRLDETCNGCDDPLRIAAAL
jgi:hypothetical protein